MNTENSQQPSKEELKSRLKMKLQYKKLQRMGRNAQEAKVNQMKESVMNNMQTEQNLDLDPTSFGFQPANSVDRKKEMKKERKKLRELEKKLGTVLEIDYNAAMKRVKENEYKKPDQRLRDYNIVKLYKSQRAKEGKIQIKEISELEANELLIGATSIGSDEESVSSNLST